MSLQVCAPDDEEVYITHDFAHFPHVELKIKSFE